MAVVVPPKPPKLNPPVVPVEGLKAAPAPKTEPEPPLDGVDPPKIEDPLTLPKIDGLLSYCADALLDGEGDSPAGFSSFVATVGLEGGGWVLSGLRKENLMFSLELNGVFGAVTVEGVVGAKKGP